MPKKLIKSFTKKDFKVVFFRGSGPGGQHRNKRDTACRITHIESGLSASAQDSKSQLINKKSAFTKLAELLIEHYFPNEQKIRYSATHKTIRSYNEYADRVTDHVTGNKFSYKHTVGKGSISEIIDSRINFIEKA